MYYCEFNSILSTSDQSYVTKGIADAVPVLEDLVLRVEAISRGTFGLIPCCNLLSQTWAKWALLRKPDIFSGFNKAEKAFFKFPTLLFYAIAHYGRNITLAN